jgi:O-antigen/teichoic acid export membrane protein
MPFSKSKKFLGKKLDKESKTLFKNSQWVFIANIFGFVLAFFRSVVLARGLGVEIFGVYTLVINFTATVLEVFNLNVGTAIIKFGAAYKTEERMDKLFALVKGCNYASLAGFGIAIIVVGFLLKFMYSSFFNFPGLEWYTIFYSFALALSMFSIILSSSLLRLFFKFKINAVVSMIMDTVELGLILLAIYIYPGDLKMFFLSVIVSKLFNGIVSLFFVYWEIRGEFKQHISANIQLLKEQSREIKSFVVTNSISGTLKAFINKGDVLILGAVGTPVMIGFYSIAKKLAFSILAVTDPLMNAIYPQLSKLVAEKKYAETKLMLRKISGLFLIPGTIAITIIFFLRKWIIVTVFGNEYLKAAEPFFFLMLTALLLAIFFWSLSMIQSLGLIKLRFVVYLLAIIFGGGASWLLIPYWGATGSAIGLLTSHSIITACFVGKSWQKLNQLEASLIKN